MNSLNLIGRLTRDPELRSLPDGRSVCDMRIAVNGAAEGSPLFVDVSTFGKPAEACAKFLAKGREIVFTGRLRYSEWQAEDGTKRSKHSAVGRVQFRGRPAEVAKSDDDIEF